MLFCLHTKHHAKHGLVGYGAGSEAANRGGQEGRRRQEGGQEEQEERRRGGDEWERQGRARRAVPASRLRVPPTTQSTASASCRPCSSRIGGTPRQERHAREGMRAPCMLGARQTSQAPSGERAAVWRMRSAKADMPACRRALAACGGWHARRCRIHACHGNTGACEGGDAQTSETCRGKRRAAGRQAGTCINSASSSSIRAASRAAAHTSHLASKHLAARSQPAPRCCRPSARQSAAGVRRLAQMVLHACDERRARRVARVCRRSPLPYPTTHDPRARQHQALASPTHALGTPARTSSRTLVHVLFRGRVSLRHGLRGTGHLEVACAPPRALGTALTRTRARGHEGMPHQSARLRQGDEQVQQVQRTVMRAAQGRAQRVCVRAEGVRARRGCACAPRASGGASPIWPMSDM